MADEECFICENVPAARKHHPNHQIFVAKDQTEAEEIAKRKTTHPGAIIFGRDSDETHYRGRVVQMIPVGTELNTRHGGPYITWVAEKTKTNSSKE